MFPLNKSIEFDITAEKHCGYWKMNQKNRQTINTGELLDFFKATNTERQQLQ